MVDNHAEIMAQIPEEPIGDEERVNPDNLNLDVTLEIKEDEHVEASWVTKGNKR